jgi:multidrug efflux pump subunit AcrA (membrane-fusion protein)
MLAGNMKLKHFLTIAGVVIAAGGGFTLWQVGKINAEREAAEQARLEAEQRENDARAEQRAAEHEARAAEERARAAEQTAARSESSSSNSSGSSSANSTSDGPSEREVDRAVMKWAGRDLGGSKKKDVTKGKPYKVNLYQDDGHTAMNRAKVDLDRDDKWDEKWTFDGDDISRQVAPADDEDYSEAYVWSGDSWAAQ